MRVLQAGLIPVALVGLVALAGLIGSARPPLSRGQAEVEIVAARLEIPWAIAFAPDGRIFVTERAGRIRVIRGGRLEAQPYFVVPEVVHTGEGGLLGLAEGVQIRQVQIPTLELDLAVIVVGSCE